MGSRVRLWKGNGADPQRQRSDNLGSRRPVADGAMGPEVVVLPAPPLREHGRLLHGVEDLPVDGRIVRAAPDTEQHLCLDKGYDAPVIGRTVRRRGYIPHIRARGEERRACRRGTRPRRWVVERTHSWFNRCRRLLTRWEKKAENYLALVQFAAVLIVWRLTG
jgi:putative transposase